MQANPNEPKKKLNIQPVTADRLKRTVERLSDMKNKLFGYNYPIDVLVDLDQLGTNMWANGFSGLDSEKMKKTSDEALSLFKKWYSLPLRIQLNKHAVRVNKKMTETELYTSLWAAFKMYGNDEDYKSVIFWYVKRLMTDVEFMTFEKIIQIFFKLPF